MLSLGPASNILLTGEGAARRANNMPDLAQPFFRRLSPDGSRSFRPSGILESKWLHRFRRNN